MLVEVKRTRTWGADWLQKAKADQREAGDDLVVIASDAVPPEIAERGGFGEIDGVFVADLRCWFAFLALLRQRLIDVKVAYAAAEGKAGAMGNVYDFAVSGPFWDGVRAILEVIKAWETQDGRLQTAVLGHVSKQRRHRDRLLTHLAAVFGGLQAAIGSSAPTVPELEFDAGDGLNDIADGNDDEGGPTR